MIMFLGAYPSYLHQDLLVHKAKSIISDQAEHVLNANVSESDTIRTFMSETFGKLTLLTGTEDDYGFRHILARHTNKYFTNYDNKNDKSLFSDDLDGNDLLFAMEQFYKHSVDIGIYNRRSERNLVFVGFVELKGVRTKCLMAVRKSDMNIITFYPFNKRRETEVLREIEERERYYYD